MITLKSPTEIGCMRKSCAVIRDLLLYMEDKVKPGVSTKKLDEFVHDYIVKRGAKPSFLGYGGFPASACISIDDVVVHGIPSARRLEEGMIVGVDVGAILDGWQSDAARTFLVGEVSEEKRRLVDTTRKSFFKGVEQFRDGGRLGDISHAIQEYVEANGFSLVREYVGHGIGAKLHEAPEVPNYGAPGHGPRLVKGMTLAIEPMVNAGGAAIRVLDDD